jgi:outer membrane protein TolC
MVGPDYEPPRIELPAAYSEAAAAPAQPTGLAEIRWWRQMGDQQLTDLVEKAVTANYGVAAGCAVAALSAAQHRRLGPQIPGQ